MNSRISMGKNTGGTMNKILLAAAMVLGFGARAMADTCLTCIFNQQSLQVGAQFHVSSGTVDGPLTVGSLIAAALNINSVTASSFNGNGALLTNLSASALGSGTVPSARVAGTYSGLTGVGTLTAGVWNASTLAAQYGGTGANLGSAPSGALPYFSGTGTMSALAAGTATYLLQSNGSSAPSYTHAPSVLGTNVTAIPMANLITGTLPSGIAVADANLSVVSASKVQGDIPGNAANINGTLAIGQLGAGTLSVNNPASSVTASGVTPGIYGGPNLLPQLTVGSDGRINSISQSGLTISAADLQSGLLASGVTVNPSQINAGPLGSGVIASSLNVTGVSPASYGFASSVPSFTVRGDGRLSAASQTPIAINTSQINNGTLTAGVVVPAANIQAGSLASNVIASSLAANGITPGVYGGNANTVAITIGADGRIQSATTYAVPGLSTSAVQNNIDNAWIAPQTFFDSVTIHADLKTNNIMATSLAGNGSGVNSLNPTYINAGVLGLNVIASSVAASGVTAGSYGSGTQVPAYTVGPDGRITAAANVTITGVPAATVPASGVLPGTLGSGVIAQTYTGGAVPNVTTFASSLTANSSLYVRGAGAIGLSPAPMGTPPAIFAFGGGLAVADNNPSDHFLMEISTSPSAIYGLAYSTMGLLSVTGIDPSGVMASFGSATETTGSNGIVIRSNTPDASFVAFSTKSFTGTNGSDYGAAIDYEQDNGDYRLLIRASGSTSFPGSKTLGVDTTAGKAEVRNMPLEIIDPTVADTFLLRASTSANTSMVAVSTHGVTQFNGDDVSGAVASFGSINERIGSSGIVIRADYHDSPFVAFSTNSTSGPNGSNNGAIIGYHEDGGDFRLFMGSGQQVPSSMIIHPTLDFDVTAGKAEVRNAPLEVLSSTVTALAFTVSGNGHPSIFSQSSSFASRTFLSGGNTSNHVMQLDIQAPGTSLPGTPGLTALNLWETDGLSGQPFVGGSIQAIDGPSFGGGALASIVSVGQNALSGSGLLSIVALNPFGDGNIVNGSAVEASTWGVVVNDIAGDYHIPAGALEVNTLYSTQTAIVALGNIRTTGDITTRFIGYDTGINQILVSTSMGVVGPGTFFSVQDSTVPGTQLGFDLIGYNTGPNGGSFWSGTEAAGTDAPSFSIVLLDQNSGMFNDNAIRVDTMTFSYSPKASFIAPPVFKVDNIGDVFAQSTATAAEFVLQTGDAFTAAPNPNVGSHDAALTVGAIKGVGVSTITYSGVTLAGGVDLNGYVSNSGVGAGGGLYDPTRGAYHGHAALFAGTVMQAYDHVHLGRVQDIGTAIVGGGITDGGGASANIVAGISGGYNQNSQLAPGGNAHINFDTGDNLGGDSISNPAVSTRTTNGGETLTFSINSEAPQTITLAADGNAAAICVDIQAKVRALTAASPSNQYAYSGFNAQPWVNNSNALALVAPGDAVTVFNDGGAPPSSLVITGGTFAPLAGLGVANGGTETSGSIGIYDWALGQGNVPGAIDAMSLDLVGLHLGVPLDLGGQNIVSANNVAATSFSGNGSGLTGVTASPTGAAGGVLAGSFPNPTLGSQVVLSSHIANGAVTTTQISGSAGITGGQIAANTVTDSNLSAGTFSKVTGLSGLTTISSAFTATSSMTITGAGSDGSGLLVTSSATVNGLVHVGWEHVVQSCGGGVTTCTATCTAGKYATGGGCTSTPIVVATISVSVLTGDSGDNFSHTCTSSVATTLSADVYCSRIAP